MKVLILGCGYVGLPLGAELARQGHQVYGVRRSQGSEAEMTSAGIIPVRANISDRATLSALPPACEWVVNCVSASGGGLDGYRRVYVEGTRNLLDGLAPQPPHKFVYTSSTGVYGQDDGSEVDESSLTVPSSDTGKVLVEAEQILLAAARQSQFPAIVLRLAGIYGPGRGYWLKQFLSAEARIDGNGNRILNMIHRDDVVGAIIAALQRGRPGEVYNVVDNQPVRQIELFQWLASRLDRPLPPPVSNVAEPGRKRGATSKRISNHRLRAELLCQLKYPTFREGFAAELEKLKT